MADELSEFCLRMKNGNPCVLMYYNGTPVCFLCPLPNADEQVIQDHYILLHVVL